MVAKYNVNSFQVLILIILTFLFIYFRFVFHSIFNFIFTKKELCNIVNSLVGKTILENMKLTISNRKICKNKVHIPCSNNIFNLISMPLCKHHFVKYLKLIIRKEFRNLYRHSDAAFGAMDKEGNGFIDINMFMKSMVCKRVEENSRKCLIVSDFKNSYAIKQKDIR